MRCGECIKKTCAQHQEPLGQAGSKPGTRHISITIPCLCWGSCWGHRGGLRCTCKEVAVAGQELPVPTACPGSCPCPRLVLLIGSSSALLLLGKPRPFPCDLIASVS